MLGEHGIFGYARGPLSRLCASRGWLDFVQPAFNGMGMGVALGGGRLKIRASGSRASEFRVERTDMRRSAGWEVR